MLPRTLFCRRRFANEHTLWGTGVCALFLLLCGLLLAPPVFAAATAERYFEGEMLIEKAGGSASCQDQVSKTRQVQVSWQEIGKGTNRSIAGWIVFAGGAPGKLSGPTPAQMTITTNYYDAHMNTPTTLALTMADGVLTGRLRETPANLGFRESVCYWQEARLTLTDKSRDTKPAQKLREHGAWYKAHAHESRGDFHARYEQSANAATAYDQAIAEVDGVLPETRAYFKGLLNYAVRLNFDARRYARAADLYQRLMEISVRQSDSGADDPDLYRGWIRLATYLQQAQRTAQAIPMIERSATLEAKISGLDLNERLLRLRLQGTIYAAEKMFVKAQATMHAEVALATAEAGPDDLRTFQARAQTARVFLAMKENRRFEAAFIPLTREITTRFGEGHAFARDSAGLLGRYFYSKNDYAQARPWLEQAFRGYRMLTDSAAQAIRQDDEAQEILGALLDTYMKQNVVAKDFIDRVKAGQVSLDDLPFGGPATDNAGFANRTISPAEWDRLLSR